MKKLNKSTLVSVAGVVCGIMSFAFPIISSWVECQSAEIEKEELEKQLETRDQKLRSDLMKEMDARYSNR